MIPFFDLIDTFKTGRAGAERRSRNQNVPRPSWPCPFTGGTPVAPRRPNAVRPYPGRGNFCPKNKDLRYSNAGRRSRNQNVPRPSWPCPFTGGTPVAHRRPNAVRPYTRGIAGLRSPCASLPAWRGKPAATCPADRIQAAWGPSARRPRRTAGRTRCRASGCRWCTGQPAKAGP